jgi:hypothetical protein
MKASVNSLLVVFNVFRHRCQKFAGLLHHTQRKITPMTKERAYNSCCMVVIDHEYLLPLAYLAAVVLFDTQYFEGLQRESVPLQRLTLMRLLLSIWII